MNAQINAELWSAYLYLSMSMDAEAKGLKGVANWFYVQFQDCLLYTSDGAHCLDFAAGDVPGHAGP